MSESKDKKIYLDDNADIKNRVEDLLRRMTLDEKISLLSKYTGFSSKPIKRLGIPEFGMTDGPHGVAPHSAFGTKNTYFPATIGLAASWNTDLVYKYGQALAEETRAAGRHCILAPGINILRTPLCGRNFEYFTEDPLLNSKLAVPLVKGIQSKRIAACVKHFICNNSEVRRRFSNSVVDKRTLNEIYMPGFKEAVEKADPWLIMGSYNMVNGEYVYEKKDLLNDILRDTWGFKGFVVSDWFATHDLEDPAKCIKAGLTLEMPHEFVYGFDKVKKSFENKEFKEEELDKNIWGFLRTLFKVGLFDPKEKIPKGSRNTEAHRDLARKIIQEGSVLLKNKGILPFNPNKVKKICIKGSMADYTPFIKSIGGSSAVKPPFFITPEKALKNRLGGKIEFVKKPEEADLVLHFTGVTHWFFNDCEGQDKRKIVLDKKQIKEIKKISDKNSNLAVILYGGGPISMDDWIDDAAAILQVWQPHQMAGEGILDLLIGLANPSGKLPVTFPKKLEDSPAHKNEKRYPGFKYSYWDMFKHEVLGINTKFFRRFTHKIDLHYEEGIFVGYRYFDTKNVEPLFPFGFGLSYTDFAYSEFELNKEEYTQEEEINISIKIKNIGDYKGSEIIQIYASEKSPKIERPVKELVSFEKVEIDIGEEKIVEIQFPTKKLSYFDPEEDEWVLNQGTFVIKVGSSSRDIKFEKNIQIKI